jgi:tetratricopeptide (TPR) repeat protein
VTELRTTRAALERLQPDDKTRYPWLAVYSGLHDELREYLLGLLSLRLDDASAAARHADALAMRNNAEARTFAHNLRAGIAAANGGNEQVLASYATGRFRVAEGLLESEFGSQALERWQQAELLFNSGRYDEALDWYNSLPEISIAGLVYLAPVHLRRAQIAERRGNVAEAQLHYSRFRELWRDADPEVRFGRESEG